MLLKNSKVYKFNRYHQQMTSKIDLGIALIFNHKLNARIIAKQSIILQNFSLKPVLSSYNFLPHITLLQINQVSIENLSKMSDILRELVVHQSSFPIKMESIVYKPEGWYFWQALKNDILQNLHFKILNSFKNYIPPSYETNINLNYYSQAERESYLNFGYRYAAEAFYPHITIGFLDLGYSDKLLKASRSIFSNEIIYPSHLTLYKQGINGAHEKTLARYTLI